MARSPTPYAVFPKMLDGDNPPDNCTALVERFASSQFQIESHWRNELDTGAAPCDD